MSASSFWKKLSDGNGNVNSNYGMIALKELINGKSQFDWCYEKLISDSESRQALINYNQPKHKYSNNKDFVCSLNQLFRIKNNKLDSRVFMRSNDLIYGFSYDVPWFTFLQQKLACKLSAELGNYYHYAASLHVYKKHFKMLEEISKNDV